MVISFGLFTTPEVGCCKPAIILSMVDLPAPFFPTRAMRSRLLMTYVILSSKVKPPNSTVKPSIEIIIVYLHLYRNTRSFQNTTKVHIFTRRRHTHPTYREFIPEKLPGHREKRMHHRDCREYSPGEKTVNRSCLCFLSHSRIMQHYMGLILDSIKSISSAVKPYFA